MSVHNPFNSEEEEMTQDEPELSEYDIEDQLEFSEGCETGPDENLISEEELPAVPQTHHQYAFGLDIDPTTGLPRITAMGRGRIAQQMLKKAAETGVEIEQDAETVGKMFKPTTDEVIPTRTYQVIAEILTFIYQVNEACVTETAARHLKEMTDKVKIKDKDFGGEPEKSEHTGDSFEDSGNVEMQGDMEEEVENDGENTGDDCSDKDED
jgi:flagellar biosynthesis protein